MEIVLNGILSGIVLAFLIGPVFFSLLQTSIEQGFRSGAFVAVGVSLSDTAYIAVCYLGLYQVFDSGNFRTYLAYFGGGLLLALGLYYLVVKNRKLNGFHPEHTKTRKPLRLVMKGFFINGLSPMVLIFWIGAIGVATSKFGYSEPNQAVPYFSAIVVTVFITDLLKAKLADKLRRVLTHNILKTLNIVVGLVLLLFGARLIAVADTFIGF